MVRKMTDDEVMDFVTHKVFGDLDKIESDSLFDKDESEKSLNTADNAKPESASTGGVKVTIEPIMQAALEGEKPESSQEEDEDDDELDKVRGMSPIMEALHGGR